MKRILILILIIVSASAKVKAQNYQARYKIKIPNNRVVYKTNKVLVDINVKVGSTVKQEYTIDNNDTTLTITKTDVVGKAGNGYKVSKKTETEFKNLGGWATLKSDEKDKSILHVNYWLNHRSKISNSFIAIGTRKSGLLTYEKSFFVKDTIVYLTKLDTASYHKLDTNWIKVVSTEIKVYSDSSKKNIAYYLINKYDRDADYTIKLQNREFISLPYNSWDFGPMTIPIKQRFGYTKGNVTVDPQFQADLNLGVFGGFTMGRYRKRYETGEPGELKDLSNLSFTLGGFLNISTADLDSTATTAGKLPFTKDKTASIGVVSFGLGVMTTIYNFQIGLFAGIDKGVGTYAPSWNYNNRPWLGIGIGYDLKKLFFK